MKWTRGLWRMTSEEEMIKFVVLWDLVESVELTPEDDKIIWKWTSHGDYTAKSAYEIQFRGSFCSFRPTAIWRAHAEGKHRFFAWLLVQEKLLTADKLMARNWSCNPTCSLCSAQPECAQHLCLHCPFAIQRSSARCVDPRLVVRYTSMPLRERTKTRRSNPHVHRVEHLERKKQKDL